VIDLGEDEIVSRLKNRDEECFITLVNEYKRRVIALCLSYAKDYHEAEDISQEVFLSLYKNIGSFREECSLSTYIYRITVSRCLDFKRKRSIKDFLTGLTGLSEKLDKDIDEKNFVQDCVKALKEELRLPVILHYYIGLNYNEIGDILNTSAKTVEGRVYRAKKKLKTELMKGGYNEWSSKGII